jgi:serine/threonine protein kinase
MKTKARFGDWSLINEREGTTVVSGAKHWYDLTYAGEINHSIKAVQEEYVNPVQITVQKTITHNVLACIFHDDDDTKKEYLVKVPSHMIQPDVGIIQVDPDSHELKVDYNKIKANNNASCVQRLRDSLLNEFKKFEALTEPHSFVFKFGGGLRGNNINMMQLKEMQEDAMKMQFLTHPGRLYIHEYLHYNREIPAIISSYCCDNMQCIRDRYPSWFEVQITNPYSVQVSSTWLLVAEQLAQALAYILSRGLVHMNINPSNILVASSCSEQLTSPHFICKLSNFEHLQVNKPVDEINTLSFFSPPEWPAKQWYMRPSTLSIYQFAAVMASLLHIPLLSTWPLFSGRRFKNDMEHLRTHVDNRIQIWGKTLFPFIQDEVYSKGHYAKHNRIWHPVATILNRDYTLECQFQRSDLLSNFLTAIKTHRAEKERARELQRRRNLLVLEREWRPPEYLYPPFEDSMQDIIMMGEENDDISDRLDEMSQTVAMPPPSSIK